MNSVKNELILALEENGYAEKEFSVITSPAFGVEELRMMFSKEGVMHKIRFVESRFTYIDIYFVYLIGDSYYDAVIVLNIDTLERISTLSKLMNGLVESFSEIEKHLTKIIESNFFSIFEVTSFNRSSHYSDPFGTFDINFILADKKPYGVYKHSYLLNTTRKNLINVIHRDQYGKSECIFSYNP